MSLLEDLKEGSIDIGDAYIVQQYSDYGTFKKELDLQWNSNEQKAVELIEGFNRIGYLLKIARDTDVLKDSGYPNYIEFAKAEYDIDKTIVSRYININDRFSEGGNSEVLQEKYRGFGYAKLSIMLQLPDAINEEITPEYSKSEIQAIKDEVDEENKISDIEVMLEGQKHEQYLLSNIDKAFHQLFEDDPELYVKAFELYTDNGMEEQAVYEMLAPNGEKTYSIRISGVGRFLLFVKEEGISLTNVRSPEEKEIHGWSEVLNAVTKSIGTGENAKDSWEKLYNKEFPEKKVEVAPVQQPPKQASRKESKVKKAPKQELKKPIQKKEPIVQQEEEDVEENETESEIIPVEPESEHVELSEVREDTADTEPDEQHSTLPVQRQGQQDALEKRKQEVIDDINKAVEQFKADIEYEMWLSAKQGITRIKADIERIEQIEAEMNDLLDTSQMRLEDYEQKEE